MALIEFSWLNPGGPRRGRPAELKANAEKALRMRQEADSGSHIPPTGQPRGHAHQHERSPHPGSGRQFEPELKRTGSPAPATPPSRSTPRREPPRERTPRPARTCGLSARTDSLIGRVMRIASLYRYPVKGLSPERLDRADLTAGGYFPGDRLFAIENGPSGFDPASPTHQPKIKFLMLMRDDELARLRTRYDDATGTLVIEDGGREAARGDLLTEAGRGTIETFFRQHHGGEPARRAEGVGGPRKRLPVHGLPPGFRVDHQSRERRRHREHGRRPRRSAALPRQRLRGRDGALGRVRPDRTEA